jgi:hypothetical protein
MNEKTINDIIADGRWNWYGEGDDMSETKKEIEFKQFCSRMWLDNCDENKYLGAITYTKDEYTSKYKDYLTEKFIKDDGVVKNGT